MTSDYEYRYSPPVSPRSQPHGCKRKASTQEDEFEHQSLISSSLKKLRLSKPIRPNGQGQHLSTDPDTAKGLSAVDMLPVGVSYRDLVPSGATLNAGQMPSSYNRSYSSCARNDEDDFMPVDDTADRIWVHDLDAEIAEIEAEEARERERSQFSGPGSQYAKIPDHLLKQNGKGVDQTSNMQMVLYRDPISISVPEEDDAVRKTISEARKRMRENQSQVEHHAQPLLPAEISQMDGVQNFIQHSSTLDGDIDMELD